MGNSFYGNGGITPGAVDAKIAANNIIEEGVMDNKITANNTIQ